MAMNSAEYAVRIAKFNATKNGKPTNCLQISFGSGSHLPSGFNAVEVELFPKKIQFKFFKTSIKRFVNDANSNKKKAKLNKFGNCMRTIIYGDEFIEKVSGFEGEYQVATRNPLKVKTDALNECFTFWINEYEREGYTNNYVNSTATISPKKPKITPDVIKRVIDKQYEEIEAKSDEELVEELINKEESGTIIPPGEELKIEEDIPLKPTTNYPETLREYAIQVLIERYTNSVKHKPERDLVRMLIEGRY